VLHDVARCVKDSAVKQKQTLVRLSLENLEWMERYRKAQQFPVSLAALANAAIAIGLSDLSNAAAQKTNNKTLKGKK